MTEKKEKNTELFIQFAIIVVLVGLLMYGIGKGGGSSTTNSGGINSQAIIESVSASEILPTGVPKIYGDELKIRYDDISATNSQSTEATISKLTQIDVSETLKGAELERYVRIGSAIACEYCCGAKTLIFSDGSPACGCAHSYAMRGLAKYLIKFHGDEFTDEQILEELGKWKVLFFPDIHEQKAAILKSQGIELNYINLASNKYRGIETGQSSGSMVGGC